MKNFPESGWGYPKGKQETFPKGWMLKDTMEIIL